MLEIALKGEVDVSAVVDLKIFFEEAKAENHRHYLVNFEHVTKLNYSVVQNINSPITNLMSGAQVHICALSPVIERMVKNTKFYTNATNYTNKKEALAAILSGNTEG